MELDRTEKLIAVLCVITLLYLFVQVLRMAF